MLFNSAEFLLFFPIAVLCYYLIPHKYRYIWIFLISYFFYMCWNAMYGLLLLGTTALTYFGAILVDHNSVFRQKIISQKEKKVILTATILICVTVLGIFKYSLYIAKTFQEILGIVHINISVPHFSLVIPVGISFYLFQSMGYVIDVYKGKIKAEKNFILYAAFISFFPQLVAGPIERADKLLPQFYKKHSFEYNKVKKSLLLMLWGFFMKIVVADRIAIFVDTVYDSFDIYGGWLLIIATILFAFQIYCDFAGYSSIAKGAAGVMGFELMENFSAPYCASGIREFWARWHISLTSWFRDYIYIPLGGNRKGKIRKYINTLIVFLLSGLWHGPSWSFVFWGGLNGGFIVAEEIFTDIKSKISNTLKFRLPVFIKKPLGTLFTFIAVDFAWVFFRASGLRNAIDIIKSMLTFDNANAFFDNTVHFYIMDNKNFFLIIVGILILLFVDICHNHNIHFRDWVEKQLLPIRWLFYWLLIMSILIFGIWGPGYSAAAFIYFQF